MNEALQIARNLSSRGFSKKEKDIIRVFKTRFTERTKKRYLCDDLLIKNLIDIYQEYWFQVLLSEKNYKQADKWLFREVSSLLRSYGFSFKKTFSEEYYNKRLKTIIEQRGFNAITGTVQPIRELEIWKKETKKTYKISLPDSKETIQTVFLKNFIIRGWLDFASIGVYYPGGWAGKKEIFCNYGAYNLKSERFKVSLLTHEAQHFSDYKRFPKLESIDLEYRAKLAELFAAKRSHRKLLKGFTSMAERNRKSPHAFANYCVVRDISREVFGSEAPETPDDWTSIKGSEISAAATVLMERHSSALKKKGAKKVKRQIK